MTDLIEKRNRVSDWLKSADEAEIDALWETIGEQGGGEYSPEIIRELDNRWDNFISGKSPSFSMDEVSQLLLNRKKNGSDGVECHAEV